ncbi:hypothetical protein FGB62_25g049 [Gracilaria domingensis]|nr:hypothetical protein FGB62_25g049 [Gracilaria domingensis]
MSVHSRGSGSYEVGQSISVSKSATHESSLKLGSSSGGCEVREAKVQSSYGVAERAQMSELNVVRGTDVHNDQRRSESYALELNALQTAVAGLHLKTTSTVVETRVEINADRHTQYHGFIPDSREQIGNPIPYSNHAYGDSGRHEGQPVVGMLQMSSSGDRYEFSQRHETVETSIRELSYEQHSSRLYFEQRSATLLEPNANDYGARYDSNGVYIDGSERNDDHRSDDDDVHDNSGCAEDYDGGANDGGDAHADCGGYVDDYNDGYNDFDDGCGDADDYGGGFDDYDDYDDGGYADDYGDDY